MVMKDSAGRRMLSCKQAAETYGCSMRYIRKLAQGGRLTHEIVAGSYMVSEDEVRRLAKRTSTGRERKRAEGFKEG